MSFGFYGWYCFSCVKFGFTIGKRMLAVRTLVCNRHLWVWHALRPSFMIIVSLAKDLIIIFVPNVSQLSARRPFRCYKSVTQTTQKASNKKRLEAAATRTEIEMMQKPAGRRPAVGSEHVSACHSDGCRPVTSRRLQRRRNCAPVTPSVRLDAPYGDDCFTPGRGGSRRCSKEVLHHLLVIEGRSGDEK